MTNSVWLFVSLCVWMIVSLCMLNLWPGVAGDCHYPEYLHTKGLIPSWYIYYAEETVKIQVKHNVLTQITCKTTGYRECHEIRKYCEISYGEDLFLVKEFIRESPWNSNSFRCIQFFKRSSSVVQIKQSSWLEQRSVSACVQNLLLLDQNPMISIEYPDENTDCPVIGGYDFQLYLDDRSGPVCDDVFLPLRLESDCTNKEGMNFYFRRRNCLNDLIGSQFHEDPIRVKCLGTWQNEKLTFGVVKWNGTADYWCIRVSYKENGDIEDVIIYFKGVCASGDGLYNRKATLKHLTRHFVQNICEDEVLVCRYQDLCSTQHRDSCKLTCSVCTPEMEEQSCVLPQVFHGKWNSLTSPKRYAVVISNSSFTQIDTTEPYSDRVMNLDWQCVQSAEDERSFRRRVLKLKFSNGCYPRYMCIDIELPAHSVMRYRTGSELSWPIESVNQVCEERYFNYNPLMNLSSEVARTAVPWMYYVHNNPQYVSCNLPWYIPNISEFMKYQANNSQSGVTGCLITGVGNQKYHLNLSYTFKNAHNVRKVYMTRRYVCLASIRAIGDNDLLILQDIENGAFACWIFIEHKYKNYIYVFEAKDCGHGTSLEYIDTNRRKAIAILILTKNSTACSFMTEEKNPVTRQSEEELSNLTVDSGVSSIYTLPFSLVISSVMYSY